MHDLLLPDPGEPSFCARCATPLEPRMDGGRHRPHCPRCGWTYYAKPALGAAIFVEEGGRILLVQRAHEPYKDYWILPAGYVEYGEDAAETAVREAMEETALVVQVTGIRGLYFGAGDPRGSSHLAVFSARRLEGTPTAGDDAGDVRWFGPAEIPERIAFDSHRKAIGQWLRGHDRPVPGPSLLDYSGAGPAPPLMVYAVIENPKGTTARFVYDARRHAFEPTGETFGEPLPIHYGWIPRTLSLADDDELDVCVVGEGETALGSVVAARPIGALLRQNEDHKVLAVRTDLPSAYATVTDASQQPALREMIDELFRPRGGLVGWASAADTRRLIMEAQRLWVERRGAER